MASVAWFDCDSGVKPVDDIFLEKRQCKPYFEHKGNSFWKNGFSRT